MVRLNVGGGEAAPPSFAASPAREPPPQGERLRSVPKATAEERMKDVTMRASGTRFASSALMGIAFVGIAGVANAAPQQHAYQVPTVEFNGATLPNVFSNFGHSGSNPTLLYLADGSSTATVAASPAWSASWSPDGRWIAYRASNWPGNVGNLMVAKADGSAARLIGRGVGIVGWSPDGRSLLMQTSASAFRTLRVGADGQVTHRRPVRAPSGLKYQSMVWAGSHAIVASATMRRRDVVVKVKLTGGKPNVLMRGQAKVVQALPNGTVLYEERKGASVRLPGGRRVKVGNTAVALTPQGQAYALRGTPGGRSTLVKVAPRTRTETVLMRGVLVASASPDGANLAVQRLVTYNDTGEAFWAVSSLNPTTRAVKDMALIDGDPDGLSEWAGSNPRSALTVAPDGSRVLIQTPFIHGG